LTNVGITSTELHSRPTIVHTICELMAFACSATYSKFPQFAARKQPISLHGWRVRTPNGKQSCSNPRREDGRMTDGKITAIYGNFDIFSR